MKSKIFKIIWIISLVMPIIAYLIVNKKSYDVYNSINYLALIILEIINILFGIFLFLKKENKMLYIIYVIFIIITLIIPIYHNGNLYAPTGPGSELMGVAFKERYLNIYGINIIGLTEYMPIQMKEF